MKKTFLKLFRRNKFIVLSSITERIFFFVIFLSIARLFPSEIYGQLVTIFSLANIFVILFDLGLPILMQRNLSASNGRSLKFFSNVLIINIIFFPVYIFFILIYYKIFYPEISLSMFLIIVISVYLFSFGNTLNRALFGLKDFMTQFKTLAASRIICMALFAFFVYFFNADVTTLLITFIVAGLIQIIILYIHLRSKQFVLSFKNFDIKELLNILNLSFPLGLAVVFNFLYDKIDILLISEILGFENVAFYNIGYGLLKTSTLSFSFLFITGLTRVSFLSQSRKGIKLFFRKYFRVLVCISLVITVILYFGAEYIIKIIYTDKFSNSIIVLKILSFATLGLALNNLTGIILTGLGLFKMNMIVTLSGLIINVILNIIFIPHYGIAGAAVITIITEYFIFTGGYFFIRKFF